MNDHKIQSPLIPIGIESNNLIIHRLAYLLRIRNVQQGLIMRTRILEMLDMKTWKRISEIAKDLPITQGTVAYHLRNLADEDIVLRHPKNKGWKIAPSNQTELTDFLKKRRKKK